jgi:hypothetical protein
MAKRTVLQRRIGATALAGLALACGSVLGIENLKTEARPDGVGGAAGGGAGTGAVGDAGTGGSSVASAGSGTAGGGSSGSGGGAGAMPAGNDSADAGIGDIVVSGHVIDFFRRPVPDVPVTIGGTTVATNALGEFTIEGVEPPYTASLMINAIRNNGQARYGYVYEGLTRDDPTLQVYTALPQRSASSVTVAYQDIVFEEDLHYVILAWSTPDGQFVVEEASGPTEYLGSPSWTGPATTTGTIHALDAFRDSTFDPPVAYQAYQSQPFSVSDGEEAAVGFNLPFDPNLSTGAISGTATGGVFDPRTNYVALRFSDGTAMPLIDESADADAFSYFVPNLPGASFIVGAADGVSSFPPYAVVHREYPTLGPNDIALGIPRPVTLTAPQVDAPVTPLTRFSWSPLAQTATTFLWHLEFVDTFQGIFVLTQRTQIELPQFPDGFTVPPGVRATWAVETHGDAPNVDAFAGPDGYLDSFSLGTAYPMGPSRNDGYYTESERRLFTMGDGAVLTP